MKFTLFNIFLAAGMLVTAAPGVLALSPSVYPQHSPTASGRWVHVTTDSEGVYQMTDAQLREMGFDDPARVHVWSSDALAKSKHLYSEELATPLRQVPSMRTADGRLLFYGCAAARVSAPSTATTATVDYVRDLNARGASYLITDAAGSELAVARYGTPAGEPLDWHLSVNLSEEELQRPVGYAPIAHGKKYSAGDRIPFVYDVRDWRRDVDGGRAMFSYVVAASTASASRMWAVCPAGMTSVKTTADMAFNVIFPTAYADNGGTLWLSPADGADVPAGEYTLEVQVPADINYSYVGADRAVLVYPRGNVIDAASPQLVMTVPADRAAAGCEIRLPGAPATTHVWAVDDFTAFAELEPRAADGYVSCTLSRAATRLLAFDASATYPSPAIDGAVPNSDLAAAATPDMLVVTTAALREAAEELADLHRRFQGLDVLVVTQPEIDAEFGAGGRHPMNTRLLAKMLYDRAPSKLKYLLMYGPTTVDQRGLTPGPDLETLVCYVNDNPRDCADHVRSYASDKYFGMLADNYRHVVGAGQPTQVAVGRVPARSEASARGYNGKAQRWLLNPPSPVQLNTALLLSGNQNLNSHVEHALRVQDTMAIEAPSMHFIQVPTKVYYPDSRGRLTPHSRVMCEALQRGVGFMGYSGHGSINFIQDASLLSTTTVNNTRYDHPPLAVLASCAQFPYDQRGSSLLETMVLAPYGGCIAGVAASRDVYLKYNINTYETMGAAYAAAGDGATVGDVYLDARRRLLAGHPLQGLYQPDELVNDMSYNLGGDPALPLYKAGTAITAELPASVAPMTVVTVTGTVLTAEGKIDTAFSGPVSLTVYDGVRTVDTRNDCGESGFKPLQMPLENDVLAVAQGEVREGVYSVTLTVPEPAYEAADYRLVASAVRSDAPAEGALGSFRLTVDRAAEGYEPGEGPAISAIYADSRDYVAGERVGADFTLCADINPGDAGLNRSTGGVQSRSRLLVDGNTSYTGIGAYLSPAADGAMRLAVPLSGLAPGFHNLSLTVADNAGRIATADLDVYVSDAETASGAAVTADRATASDAVMLGVEGVQGSVERLVVLDADGRTVYTAARPALPLRWDLTSTEGTAVADGQYTVRAFYRDGTAMGEAKPASVVVIR